MQKPAASTEPVVQHWVETLRDESRVFIRPMVRTDGEQERAFIEGLSPTSRRLRFLGQFTTPSDALVTAFTDIDQVRDVAYVATAADSADAPFVGVSRYSAGADGKRGECAVVVSDAWQDKGLGTALMQHLIDVARSHGLRSLYSLDASSNHRMAELVHSLGFTSRTDPDDATQMLHELEL
jgi:acetyltransferase